MAKEINYKKTLNLPKTDFPLWVNHKELQEKYLNFWESKNIYQKIRKAKKGNKKYILHDGPPYANGNIHVGHVLNKVLKDIVVKYKTMSGYDAPYIPGWDCHGLPIEHAVIDKDGLNKEKMSDLEIRKKCKSYALEYVRIQKKQFEELGVLGDWDSPYLTLDPIYEAKEYEVLAEFVKKGLVFQEKKPVAWCTHCQTALADAELEYKDKESHSIYVKFPLKEEPGFLKKYKEFKSIIAWTTTPWTLPANVALALHPKFIYVAIKARNEIFILAEKLLKQTVKELGIKNYKILKKFKGQSLLNYKVLHPLPESLPSDAVGSSAVVLADFVESDQGTGVVHIAPGHGFEDYLIGKKYNLPLCSPVDQKGIFTKEAGKFSGLHVFKANEPIIESLKNRGILLGSDKIIHSYPCCWRCKNPIIFRATKQWFIKTKALRTKAINLIKKVKWIPAEGLERMELMLLEKPDWCISRQRKWGIPIPSLICQSCHENILEPKVINNVREIVLKEGSDAWFEHDLKKFLPTGFKCPKCGSNKFKKGKDILDVWFDSGISFLALVAIHKGLSYPSDLYLEGSDQHRGWFQSSLLTNVGFKGTSPYKAVLTHGFTVDDKGNKMSKSLGNVVDPLKVQEIFGNEILRLWAASVDYSLDVSISSPKLKKDTAPILEQVSEMYFKLRNTLRFILGNLHDFDYKKDKLDYKDWQEIDKWIIAELQNLIDDYNHYFKEFKFYKAVNKIYYFSTVTLSAIYFDILKDRLYTYGQKSKDRLSAQNALSVIFTSLVSMLTPVLSFTTEEAWSSFPKFKNKSKSSLFLPWIYKDKRYENSVLIEKYKIFLSFRDKVNESLDKARRQKIVSSSLEAKAELIIKSKKEYELLKKYEKDLPSIFIVSQIQLKKANKDSIQISKASGKKCIRCWKYSKTVGQAKLHPEICNDCLEVINKYNR